MGATEKRRESGAVCRDMGDLSWRGEWGVVYQERILGAGEAGIARITTSNEDVAVCGIRQGSAVDHPALYTGSDKTSWELPIRGYVSPDLRGLWKETERACRHWRKWHPRSRQRLLDFRERYSSLRLPDS